MRWVSKYLHILSENSQNYVVQSIDFLFFSVTLLTAVSTGSKHLESLYGKVSSLSENNRMSMLRLLFFESLFGVHTRMFKWMKIVEKGIIKNAQFFVGVITILRNYIKNIILFQHWSVITWKTSISLNDWQILWK